MQLLLNHAWQFVYNLSQTQLCIIIIMTNFSISGITDVNVEMCKVVHSIYSRGRPICVFQGRCRYRLLQIK